MTTARKNELDKLIQATKNDILQDHDINDKKQRVLANEILLDSFKDLNAHEFKYVRLHIWLG